MTKVMVKWHAKHDDRTCPVCKDLDNYIWEFDLARGEEVTQLEHPELGVVSTVEQGSLIPHDFVDCRCTLEFGIDWTDMIAVLTRIRDNIKRSLESPELEVTRQ